MDGNMKDKKSDKHLKLDLLYAADQAIIICYIALKIRMERKRLNKMKKRDEMRSVVCS